LCATSLTNKLIILLECDAGGIHANGYLRQKLDIIAKHVPEAFEAHFIRYVDNLNNGEFEGSLDSFHRYFDYWVAEHKEWVLLFLPVFAGELFANFI
jgi:hypothetical protein